MLKKEAALRRPMRRRTIVDHCGPETSVPDWVIDRPESLRVFEELGIDYSCGGKSLETACRERGLDVGRVMALIEARK